MADIKLWGFQGSTYARTVRMVLAEKGVTNYERTEVNVLAGEPRSEAHRRLHPFGKVPVVEIDGMRLIETSSIARYLNVRLPGRDLVPADIRARARMDMAISIVDAYGYPAIVGGVAAYHLFPDFVGGKDDNRLRAGVRDTLRTLTTLMEIRGASPYLVGDDPTLADLHLAPLVGLLEAVPERGDFMDVEGLAQWWSLMSERASFRSTL